MTERLTIKDTEQAVALGLFLAVTATTDAKSKLALRTVSPLAAKVSEKELDACKAVVERLTFDMTTRFFALGPHPTGNAQHLHSFGSKTERNQFLKSNLGSKTPEERFLFDHYYQNLPIATRNVLNPMGLNFQWRIAMPRGVSNKRKVAEATISLRRLIINADARALRWFAKGRGLGARTNVDGTTYVCFTRGSMQNPQDDIDQVEVYLEPPIHQLSVCDPCMPFSLDACKDWLCSRGIDCNIAELVAKHSGAALERKVAQKLFSHAGVCFAYKYELLKEVDEVMEVYSDNLACRIGLRTYHAQDNSRLSLS